jgi:hypothetical protein
MTTSGQFVSRRGGAYVAVLGVAALTTVIGMASMWSARTTHRTTTLTGDTARARHLAEAAVELALIAINSDSYWRDTVIDDDWSTPQACNGAQLSYKFVDEIDGDLSDDADQPFRVYGRADVGDAVRIVSVRVEPFDPGDANIIDNGGGESGTAPWLKYLGDAEIEQKTDKVRAGTHSLMVKGRKDGNTGMKQSVLDEMIADRTYDVTVWFWPKKDNTTAVVGLRVKTTEHGYVKFEHEQTVHEGWNEVTAQLAPTWTGTPTKFDFYVGTTGDEDDFWVDDIEVAPTPFVARPAHRVVAGTWRREVE